MTNFTPLSGRFYRITFADDAAGVLGGVIHHEGRFHHDHQPALYCSPTPDAAAAAVKVYAKPDDPPRVITMLDITGANICDLRDPATCAALGITLETPSVPWINQRANGIAATSWLASDAVRAANADGMIYTCRREPLKRWHLVLFDWNSQGRPTVEIATTPEEFKPYSSRNRIKLSHHSIIYQYFRPIFAKPLPICLNLDTIRHYQHKSTRMNRATNNHF